MDFGLSEQHRRLQERCQQLAADFATRSSEHDRDASHPTENYDRLRQEGFLELTVPKELGGAGVSFLGHTVAYEALGQGCPSTALSFNMHASVVMPLLASSMISREAKEHIADLVVRRKQLLAGNYSEATSTALLGERWLDTVVRRTSDGPLYSPYIAEIEVLRRGKVRRAKLYYLRGRRGKSARIFERTDARAKRLNAAFKGFKRPKGEPDDLTKIKGVSAELAGKLGGLGVIKFDQVANFSDEDIANVDEMLALEGRIEKDDWVRQAQSLVAEAAAAELPAEEKK